MEDFKDGELRNKKRNLCSKQKKKLEEIFFYSKCTKDRSKSDTDEDLMSLADSSSEETFLDLEQPEAFDAVGTVTKKNSSDDFAFL